MKKFIAIFAAGFLVGAALALEAAQPISPVSVPANPGNSGAGNSFAPAFSANGRFVVFVSHANNLVTNDDHGLNLDVFVRDLVLSNTVLVSVNSSGIGGGNDDANSPSISSNGQFVAFASHASNLVNNDTNGACDVFVRDLVAGTTALVSVDATGTNNALGPSTTAKYPLESTYPLISADGRWVAFQSSASNLVSLPDTNRAPDVFIRDLQSNVTYLVSINADGTGSANDKCELASMTPDGRFVAFTSSATDLVPGNDGMSEELYVRDMANGVTYWASSNVFLYLADSYRCFFPDISADGRSVAFKAETLGNLIISNALVLLNELGTGVTTLLDSDSFNYTAPSMSADGRFTAFDSARDVYGYFHGRICLWDSLTQTSAVVSLTYLSGFCHCPATGLPSTPVLSSDGSKIAFLFTLNTNYEYPKLLTSNTVNLLPQLYVRDLINSNNQLVTVRPDGTGMAEGLSFTVPAISPDGSKVAFECTDELLVPGDNNRASDVFVRDLAAGTTDLVSARHPDCPANTGSGNSWIGPNCVSADGQVIVFSSLDSNLHDWDTNGWQDAYVRDLTSNSMVPLAYPVITNGPDGSGPPQTNNSWFLSTLESGAPVISANGRVASYMLVGGTGTLGSARRVYWGDLSSRPDNFHSFMIQDFNLGGMTVPDANPFFPSALSSDGRFWISQDGSVDRLGWGYNSEIYAQGRNFGSLLLSMNASGAKANAFSIKPILSPDDRWVVFQSQATDIKTNVPGNGGWQLFAGDLKREASLFDPDNPNAFIHLVSYGTNGAGITDSFTGASFSADSRYAAFYSITNLTVYRHDLYASNVANVVVCTNCLNPSLGGDGRFIAYEGRRGSSLTNDIFVKDLQTGDTQLVSVNRAGTGGGNASSSSPQISYDGRFIVFASRASDLVDNDTNSFTDVFVRDRLRGITMLLSLNGQGTGSGNSASSNPILAADGRTVVFQSFATDLAPGLYNDTRNIFVMRLGGADTDHDGMDDDWEVAYFGDLSLDGTGDFDGDGMTDLQEFLAGTDPKNDGSILSVLTVTPLGQGATTVFWSATPGKTYRVQFKDNINDADWTDLPETVTATYTTASAMDTNPLSTHRFYRVLLIP